MSKENVSKFFDLTESDATIAEEIAHSAPLAVRSIRETLRGDLAEAVRIACERELAEQQRLQQTEDFREGVAAMSERRRPAFKGR